MSTSNTRQEVIVSSHGDGGLLTHELLQRIFFPAFSNQWLDQAGDAAMLTLDNQRLAMTTDSFVVSPLFFPGGDIGKLAVCGTVNDLIVSGARPLWLSAAFILPEGMPLRMLETVVQSMADTARGLRLPIITGDTKVADNGGPENLFISTTGIGLVHTGADLHPGNIEPTDVVIVSGTIGDHGAAILSARLGLAPQDSPTSDCAPLNFVFNKLQPLFPGIKVMRDPTRGGIATTLIELASSGKVDLVLEESSIPIKPKVKAVADLLGVDPYYLASEGKALLVVKQEAADAVLRLLREHPQGEESAVIGVAEPGKGNVYLRTSLGGTRQLRMLAGTPLPRIC